MGKTELLIKMLAGFIAWSFNQVVVSLIAWLSYLLFLKDLVGLDVSFLNWVGIVIISTCLFTSGSPIKANINNSENSEKSKFDFYGRR